MIEEVNKQNKIRAVHEHPEIEDIIVHGAVLPPRAILIPEAHADAEDRNNELRELQYSDTLGN